MRVTGHLRAIYLGSWLVFLLAGSVTESQTIQPIRLHRLLSASRMRDLPAPTALADEGDYYLMADGTRVHLLRSRNEVAARFVDDNSDLAALPALQSIGRARFRTKGVTEILRTAGTNVMAEARTIAASARVRHAFPVLVEPKSRARMIPTDEILARLAEGVRPSDVQSALDAAGLELVGPTGSARLNVYLLRLRQPKTADPLLAARQLARSPRVRWAAPNFLREMRFFSTPDDPLFVQQQALDNTGQNGAVPDADIDAAGAWDLTTGTNAVVIAIIDDGVDTNHSDLAIAAGGWDFADADGDPSPVGSNGHGTGCAGIAAALINNGNDITGIAGGCRVLPIKIADDSGIFTTDQNIGDAIQYAADHADVLSDSWGGGSPVPYIDDAIHYAVTDGRGGKGCPVFFAAGNSASSWYQGGARYLISTQGLSGDYYFAFYYYSGGGSAGEETVRVDNVSLLGPDGYTHLANVLPDQDFESWFVWFLPPSGWWLSGDAPWEPSSVNALTGTGGSISAASPSLSGGQRAWLVSPLVHVNGDETLAFAASVSIDANSLFYALAYDADLNFVGGVDLGSGVPDVNPAVSYPASNPDTIAVGASTDCDFRSDYSAYDGQLDFVAPSNGGHNDITTLDPTGAVGWTTNDFKTMFGGTSSSAPLSAGTAALMLSVNPNLTATEVRELMRQTCDKIGGVNYTDGTNQFYGYGRINARRAVGAAMADLALNQSISPEPVCLASNVTCFLTVGNLGPSTATGVILNDTPSAGLAFVSATPSQGACATNADGSVTCALGDLGSNTVATIEIVFISVAEGTATNTASVMCTVVDSNPSDNATTSTITVPFDIDCDGVPDAWMEQYFGHPDGQAGDLSRAGDDPDGDGFTNRQEFQAGTDPTASVSTPFRITEIAQEGDDVRIMWTTVGGTTNVVQVSPGGSDGDYTNDFADLSPEFNIAGEGAANTNYLDSGAVTNFPSRFYRLRLIP